jgi:DNA repair photolyase
MKAISESALWKKRLGDWVLNPYVGCEHACFHCYCPAMPGVKFHNEGRSQRDWGKYLLQKKGFIDAVKQTLRTFTPDKAKRTAWGDGWLLMSFLTDCYTPAEAKLKVTRECLKLLLDAGHKVRIQTRSALVERDFDILTKHADLVLLGTSLPYLDDKLARVLEPKASSPTRRLRMLEKAAAAGLRVYVAAAPFMPFTDLKELVGVWMKVKTLNPREIFCEVLNPKGDNIGMMIETLNAAGFVSEMASLRDYDEAAWAYHTHEVLQFGHDCVGPLFVPWPDTGRAWSKHLLPGDVDWLDQFLPSSSAVP